MKLNPVGENILAKRKEAEAETDFGLIIPDNAQDKPQEGEVLAVGDDVASVKAGDKILFQKYGPTSTKHEGETYIFLKEEDLLAIIL